MTTPWFSEFASADEASIAYHEASSISADRVVDSRWMTNWDAPPEVLSVDIKEFPRTQRLALNESDGALTGTLAESLLLRRADREPTTAALSSAELSALLRWTFAADVAVDDDGVRNLRRFYPSAGARFPIEAYVLALRCEGVERGVYHVAVPPTHLEQVPGRRLDDACLRRAFGYQWIQDARAVVVLAAVLERSAAKYGTRAYRYCMLEAGHAMQTLCLVASHLGVRACPVGGFADFELGELIRTTDPTELPLYAGVLP